MSAARAQTPAQLLHVAHFVEPAHPVHATLLTAWAERLERASEGRLRLEIHHSGARGRDPQGQLDRLRNGVADIVWGLPAYTPERFPRTLIASLPGFAPGAVEGTRMLWRAMPEWLAPEYAEFKLLALWMNEPSLLLTRAPPVRRLADLAGRTLRPPTVVGEDLLLAWGAIPLKSRIEAALPALRSGSLDGVLMDAGAIMAFKLHEAATRAIEPFPSVAAVFYLAMRSERWVALAPDLRAILDREAGETLSIAGACSYVSQGIAAREAMRRSGVVTVAPDAEFGAALTAAAEKLAESRLRDLEGRGVPARAIAGAMRAPDNRPAPDCPGAGYRPRASGGRSG